jgi:hypothetical protein
VLVTAAAGCIVTRVNQLPQARPEPPATQAVTMASTAPLALANDLSRNERTLTTDEGMWLLNDFPSEQLRKLHGFAPSQQWLEHVQSAAVRFAGGCSGSFVSSHGLLMTNHHCASYCIQQLSTAQRDYVKSGFNAKDAKDELKCPDMEVNQLVSISDVTEQVNKATLGKTGALYHTASKSIQTEIERNCTTSTEIRCDVVSLYRGGRYHLYKYRRFQDIRLVFAPEFATAFFGGDPDNFMFPRYDLDVAFLRVYENGQPMATPSYFRWSVAGAKEGDLTFVAGHPWHSSRELTVAQLEVLRDRSLPDRLLHLAENRGLLTEFQRRGAEQKRITSHLLFGTENSFKAIKGRLLALHDPEVFGAKVAEESSLKARVQAKPELKATVWHAWQDISEAERRFETIRLPYLMIEQGRGFWSELFDHARRLLRATTELTKPNEMRLREYTDAQRPVFTRQVGSAAPIYDELEILTLTHSLTQLREELGPDNFIVTRVLGKQSPFELATRLVKGTRLKDAKIRKALLEGGVAAISKSSDPMLELARTIDSEARAVRKDYEDNVGAVIEKSAELIAKARFEVQGTNIYPDATGTLRLSFGEVRGYEEGGKVIDPFTDFRRAFERATDNEPFMLPKSWLDSSSRLDLATPLNFCTTNDIIGGNSGSPVIDRDAQIVGIIFDGNIYSLGGDYAYEPRKNRAVAVHSAAITQALEKIYRAKRIVEELQAARQ